MQRLLLVLLITTGAVSLSGCGFFNRGDSDEAAVENLTIPAEQAPQTVQTADGQLPNLPEGEGSDGVVVAASPNSPTVVARDLIQSTDPNERTIGVERTRPDPFAGLTIPLVPPQPIEVEGANTNNRAGGRATSSQTASVNNSGSSATAAAPNSATPLERPSVAEVRSVESSRPEIAALPEIPQPTTAKAVRVSGVIQIGGAPYAIIKAPDEIERYVRQGERVAGGRVLVKRIDTGSAEPRVILVENGIEVESFVTAADVPVEEAPAAQPADTVSTISTLPELPSPGI
ncbi:hypothetical protein IQ260_10510 [Leptolyngbya cf. ectocarpi LEGE 11479]|uniref:Uncharacterized protein n=1 Tax=Leptolyngbya cf. ectocarpi LEGE 11479 TaxID=1828722 RepID=A0A928X3H9_LEPEC|nr:hypothetical protein [Leptolyngbya ectocarpi]MBE9067086.1 hypothetical protein [Leptolyngbya cf. ectocarpi LEGE 11479]